MTEINQRVLNLITQNKTINEICSILKLTRKQLYRRLLMLENNGLNLDRNYFYSGDITYTLKKELNKTDGIDIITSPNDDEFTAMLISDLHLGNESENLDALDKIYNYCIENNINIIINAGDLIDGVQISCSQKITELDKQMDYALKVYPFDKNILNFIVLGNHDFYPLKNMGIDFDKLIKNKRHDIISLGYEIGEINIKNDSIIVNHPIANDYVWEKYAKLIICGHAHRTRIINKNRIKNITVPSLSDMSFNEFPFPKAILMNLSIRNGMIESGRFNELLITDKIYKLNEFDLDFTCSKNMHEKQQILLENNIVDEYRFKNKIKQKSQTEKFNEKYNL